MLSGFGITHGVDLDALVDASEFICKALGRRNVSHVAQSAACCALARQANSAAAA